MKEAQGTIYETADQPWWYNPPWLPFVLLTLNVNFVIYLLANLWDTVVTAAQCLLLLIPIGMDC